MLDPSDPENKSNKLTFHSLFSLKVFARLQSVIGFKARQFAECFRVAEYLQ